MVNLKKKDNKEKLISFKNKMFKEFDTFIISELEVNYKKTANIIYWLRDYKNYLKQEKTFDPNYNPIYEKGSIVQVNLGFNLGSEHGGLHYGIVLNNKDTKNNPILTIVPLSSIKESKSIEDLKPYEVYLGDEIYNSLDIKINLLSSQLKKDMEKLQQEITTVNNTNYKDPHVKDEKIRNLEKQLQDIKTKYDEFEKCHEKFSKLKKGSYALVKQITTISKIRISDPINSTSPLTNVKISDASLNKILKNVKIYID